jgi:hypothetical protein
MKGLGVQHLKIENVACPVATEMSADSCLEKPSPYLGISKWPFVMLANLRRR